MAATPRTPGLSAVTLSKDAATDYDPEGDGQESPSQVQFAIDGNQTTVWDSETYEGGFEGSNKSGVGLYVHAGDRVAARQLDVLTSTPGFTAAVYASDSVPSRISDWDKVSPTVAAVKREQVFHLDTARPALPQLPALDLEAARGRQGDDQGARPQEVAAQWRYLRSVACRSSASSSSRSSSAGYGSPLASQSFA